MAAAPREVRIIRRLLIGLAIVLACAALAVPALFWAVDSGRLNPQIAGFASSRLKRPVAFRSLQTHLLSARPSIAIGGLRVASPAWAGTANLFEADLVRLELRWPDLALVGVEVERPQINLVRLTHEQTNWSGGGSGGGGGAPRSLRTLWIKDGRFTFDDRVADMRLSGTASYGVAGSAAFPLVLSAKGSIKGGEVQATAEGGPLTGRPADAPYPFSARLQDGATVLEARGTSDKPAQLSGFDLDVASHGPNLADMKYMIGLGLPNSAPYRLTARLSRKGPTTRATQLKAVIGQSDFVGSVISDGSAPRRLITVALASQTLYAADVGTLLGHIPDHAATRSVSGAAKSAKAPGPLLSTTPIDLKRFRVKDARFDITARRFVIDGVSPGRLSTVGALDHGKFTLKPFRLEFPSGRADLVLGLDINGPDPAFRLGGTVRDAALGTLIPSLAKTVGGTADLSIDVAGAGPSWRAIGLNARGRVGLRLRDGEIQTAKADVLSGAVIQGAFNALANKDARTALSCAVADAAVGRGQIVARRLLLVTPAGTAVAEGGVDLARETIDLTFYGQPARFRLLAVRAPVSITGPMLHPSAKIRLPGSGGAPRTVPAPPKLEGDPAAFCRSQLAMP